MTGPDGCRTTRPGRELARAGRTVWAESCQIGANEPVARGNAEHQARRAAAGPARQGRTPGAKRGGLGAAQRRRLI
jgi:hypothetical protein